MITYFLIAVGLAIDATTVSVAQGLITKKCRIQTAFRYAISFGLFQMAMPLLGWWMGANISHFVEKIDHWIAFGLLLIVGGKMIHNAFQMQVLETSDSCDPNHSFIKLMTLSVATSIDAFAIGLTFAFLHISFVVPIIIIGVVTFLLSFCGFFLGTYISSFFGNKIEAFGGLILIGIGIKILIEHL